MEQTDTNDSGVVTENVAPAGGEIGSQAGTPAGAGTTEGVTNTSVSIPENWKDVLPSDLKDESSLGLIQSIPDLAKSYVNAQRLIGKDKITIPDQHATEDDWKNVYQKLGLPADLKEYDVPAPEGADEDFHSSFKEIAFGLNILPEQAKGLLEWYGKYADQIVEGQTVQTEAKRTETLEGLKKEWGRAYDTKASFVKRMLEKFGDEQTAGWLAESGLGDDPRLIKLFADIGQEMYGEDVIPGEAKSALTPKQAQERISSLYAPGGALTDKYHPNHAAALRELTELSEMVVDTSFNNER